jgi:hypothetical protein
MPSHLPTLMPAGTAGEAPLGGVTSGELVRQWLRAALPRTTQSDQKVTRQVRVSATRAPGMDTITTGVGRGQARGKPGG